MGKRRKEKSLKKRKRIRKQKKISLKKTALAAVLAMLIMIGGTYVGLAVFFENHYFFHTVINGKDCSYLTATEAEILLYTQLNEYELEIEGREDLVDRITAKEIGMEYQWDDNSLKELMEEQKSWKWILSFFGQEPYELYHLITYDEKKLETRLEELKFFQQENVRPAKEAYISYFPAEKRYKIVEADPGTQLKEEMVTQRTIEALTKLETKLDLEKGGYYLKEKKEEANSHLEEGLVAANKYMDTRLTYDWNENQVIVDADRVSEWVDIEGASVILREDKVYEFVKEQAQNFDNYAKNKYFKTTDGRQIELNTHAYGWKTEVETETEELVAAIRGGMQLRKKPAHTYVEPSTWQVELGDTYVEMDLNSQRLYLYVEGSKILESDFVSGNVSRGWTTPPGVFGLTYKTRNAVLRGENYATPVSYWMPFNGNIGMHDATWRGSFGGEIYKSDGSHGCINLPYEKAKIIYEYVYTGFPIVCYY